ncbi:MAG: catechol 2,3-dioxygenase [Acidimicrobiia bacterium]|nr:catechol 2,3-dioxygenase [bacterium]MXX63623.1 catechol 2,3-dioxygenase [Acidimicrobiia bacterium]MCY3580169.1 catechol 2,3-dioxygenase [bacterium]MCY3651440.1 catechol 2,3-dioxygenase [bacterium]MXZ07578.1 catechol 2,3-dioxygenase [Acidimicrobiia bacterium]
MGILRLSHVDITVPDLDLATAYYTDVMGMIEVERTTDRVFFKCWDEEDHHSLAVRYHPRVGIDRFSFKVEEDDDLAEMEARVEAFGFHVDRISRGEEIGQGESIRFATPSGHTMELVKEVEKLGSLVPKVNPLPLPPDLPGIAPPRMDHLLVTAEEVGEATRFYTDVLGFRVTEQLLDGDGHQIGTWMERSHSPHDLAVVSGPNGGLHHFAFWLDAWDDVRRSADILAYHAIQIDVGPTRHGITRGSTIYFFDPMGTRNEVFTGGYRPDPDFPTITWTEDNIGKAIFYYEGELNERFMKVHT